MLKKICCIFNYPPHYREEIYKKIETEFNTDFYFGDIEGLKIKKINDSAFIKQPIHLKTLKLFGPFNWILGSIKLCFKDYDNYIITGEYLCLSSWFILIINKILGKKTYTWTHGWYGKEKGLIKLIKRIYFRLPTTNLVYGERAKELMILDGFNPKNITVIYNSLQYEEQISIRKNLVKSFIFKNYFKNNFPVILFTGRLTKIKKLDQLLSAQKKLIEKGIYLNVMIVGEGEELNTLKDFVKINSLEEYIFFYGACYNEDIIADFYYNALCCVSPGNVGLTGIHAMTYGCPVISHDDFKSQMPEFEVIINNVNGFYFHKDNIDDLVSKIELILDYDREILRANSFKIIDQKFNTRNQINILKSLIK